MGPPGGAAERVRSAVFSIVPIPVGGWNSLAVDCIRKGRLLQTKRNEWGGTYPPCPSPEGKGIWRNCFFVSKNLEACDFTFSNSVTRWSRMGEWLETQDVASLHTVEVGGMFFVVKVNGGKSGFFTLGLS